MKTVGVSKDSAKNPETAKDPEIVKDAVDGKEDKKNSGTDGSKGDGKTIASKDVPKLLRGYAGPKCPV